MSHSRWRPPASNRGQSLVEFALVGPMFLGLVFVILEGGLMLNAQASLDNAAREGAREAVVCPNDQNSPSPDQCYAAVNDAVVRHLGISNDPAKASVIICVPDPRDAANYPKPCPSTADSFVCQVATPGSYDGAVSGAAVEVDVYYRFDYFIGDLFGPVGPSTCMSSRARSTAQ